MQIREHHSGTQDVHNAQSQQQPAHESRVFSAENATEIQSHRLGDPVPPELAFHPAVEREEIVMDRISVMGQIEQPTNHREGAEYAAAQPPAPAEATAVSQ